MTPGSAPATAATTATAAIGVARLPARCGRATVAAISGRHPDRPGAIAAHRAATCRPATPTRPAIHGTVPGAIAYRTRLRAFLPVVGLARGPRLFLGRGHGEVALLAALST